VSVYVAYLKYHPDETKINDLLQDLRDKNIDVSLLADWTADDFRQTE